MAASEQAYNRISNRINTYENMLDELNNTTDLKASVDLQARIAENGMILNELYPPPGHAGPTKKSRCR